MTPGFLKTVYAWVSQNAECATSLSVTSYILPIATHIKKRRGKLESKKIGRDLSERTEKENGGRKKG